MRDVDDRIDIVQGRLALVAVAEHVQRLALVHRGGELGVGQGSVAAWEVATHIVVEVPEARCQKVLGRDPTCAADDFARPAVHDTGGVHDCVSGEGEALDVNTALEVDVGGFARGPGQIPVDVLDEADLIQVAAQGQDVALDFTRVVLAALRAEHRVTGPLTRDRRTSCGAFRVGVGGPVLDHVRRDGVLHVLRQEGVVRIAQVELRDCADLVGPLRVGTGRTRSLVQEDVEEGRLRDVEGVFGDVLVLDRQVDVVGDREVGADLVTLRGRFRNAGFLAEVVRVFTVATDVQRPVRADIADALAEVGQTGGGAFIPIGLGGIQAVAVGAGQSGTAGQRHIGIRQRAGALRVGERGLTPARTRQGANAAEHLVVEHAVVRRVGRVGVDTDEGMGGAEPVDVHALDHVDVFVFSEGIQVQTVVKQVGADQGGDALVGLTVLVDHAVVGVDFHAFEVATQLEVQHAGDGVGAVNRRGAAGDDFDVLDQQTRDGVDVDSQVARRGADVATAVNQGQRPAGAERAQVGEGQTTVVQVRAGRVRGNQRVRQGGDGGQVVDDRRLTGAQQRFTRHLDERGRGVGRVTTDARTGDDDFVDLGRLRVGPTLNVDARELVLGEGRSRDGHDAREDRRAKEVLALEKHGDWAPTVVDAIRSARRTTDSASDLHASSKAGNGKGLWPLGDQSGPRLLQSGHSLATSGKFSGGILRRAGVGQRFSRSQPAARATIPPRWTRGASAAEIWRDISLRAETASRGP